ncbi:hypothetical protein CH379_010360 [Leptospira ellisii]|uniref:Iron dicitrate transport regulator FecR n=1 Tax=Leptospira ellisii TaxID=2023197 RepID=A0A2N0B9Z3_9LEPT|nr:hypothetical protein [Leptospira ellisii]MDV6236024.1 hypothetical protein [Leptospira ellisii]PJZ93377.1 hypothetical protein CH379_08070 [Leptospira ellisii]PKA06215.1 hypothetical protein CH375_00870 [Leptospira ellisii]
MNPYSKFRKEIHVGFASFAILSASLFLFWREGAVDLDWGKKESVGNITFKYRTAQRKLSDRMVWQDVEQNFPIFNHDSVRTDELSEAVVTLVSGTKFELDPRSMIVINLKEEEEMFGLEEGSVKVHSSKTVRLVSGKTEFKSVDQSLFRITREEKDGENLIEVEKGNLKWIQGGGETVTVPEGRYVKISQDVLSTVGEDWNLEEPPDNHRIFPESGEAKVGFRWKANSQNSSGVLEVALSRNFHPLILKKEFKGETSEASLPEGIYYWRLSSPDRKKLSSVRKFRILPNPPVTLLFPLKNTNLEGNELQSFRWKPSRLATGYILEISESPDFKTGLRQLTVFKTSISIPLSGGKYHWRVRSFSGLPGTESVSEIRSFQVEKGASAADHDPNDVALKNETDPSRNGSDSSENKRNETASDVPVLAFPAKGKTVDMTGKDSIVFRWKHTSVSKDVKWSLTLYGGSGDSILKRNVQGESFRLTDLSVLDVGKFSWSLTPQDGNGEKRAVAEFKIVLREELAAPETKSSGKRGE